MLRRIPKLNVVEALALKRKLGLADDLLLGDLKVLVQLVDGRRAPNPSCPQSAPRCPGSDPSIGECQPRRRCGACMTSENLLAVFWQLVVEQFLARHTDHPRGNASRLQFSLSLETQIKFGSGTDQNDLRLALAVAQDISHPGQCARREPVWNDPE